MGGILKILEVAAGVATGAGAVTQGVAAVAGLYGASQERKDLRAARREDLALAHLQRDDNQRAQHSQNRLAQQHLTMNLSESAAARGERADDRAYGRGQDHLNRVSEIFNKSTTLRERIGARFRARKGVA